MTKTTFRIRRPSMDDAQAVCDLVASCDTEDLGAPDIVVDDIVDMWSRFDLDNNVWVVENTDTALIGSAFLEEESEEKLFNCGCVLPTARGIGVGSALVSALEERAAALRNESDVSKRLQSMISTLWEDAARLLEDRGFASVRYFKRTGICMDAEPLAPALPEGFIIEPVAKDRDEQTVYDGRVESFADHWDFAVPPFEKWVEKTQMPTFDERWWMTARDPKGAVAGFALGRMRENLLFIE